MSPSDRSLVRLVASASPGSDIFVIDSQFRIVGQGVRRLEKLLPPGIYKVKFQAGDAIHEEHVTLEPGSDYIEVRAPRLEFHSSAPLAETQATHEYHMENAARLSRAVHVHHGHGAKLFVFARAWTEPTGSEQNAFPRGQHPAAGLSIFDIEGRLVADLEQSGTANLNVPDPWSGCTIELAPGPYRLRAQVPEIGVLEQIVVAPPGWEAQVFLLQQDYGDVQQPLYRADLTTASILLSADSAGFNPASDNLRLTELARTALTRQRVVVAGDLLQQMLESKFENPMLGLYGAHALCAAPDPNRALLTIVVRRLREMLGLHPDIDALALYLDQPLDQPVNRQYKVPPMLRRSWSIVVEQAARRHDLVPSGSLASRVGSAIWGNSAWLIWDGEAADESTDDLLGLEENVLNMENISTRLVSSESHVPANVELDDVEQAMLSYAARSAKYGRKRASQLHETTQVTEANVGEEPLNVPIIALPNEDPFETVTRMAEGLGLPPSTVQTKMGRLLRKLDRPF